ncbi:cyd operon YbgE family protein [Sphaerotilus sp.]|uniref:cyd operon YbgE family protein n=1 Tax=Sphaerotilus sp. TaxID=2093942 RepID=UPI002ACEBFB8|nr:cyd operon YbgE family protein [Sphaerotilus sp.]MDZ7855996.1 cyd operon YbgE family protein [Sphaerotilus sp.]
MTATAVPAEPCVPRTQWPSLAAALVIMVAGTLYPPAMADAAGKADHPLAMALFWAMSAGFVRGVGFVPQRWVWRALFSGWSCAAALLLAAVLKLQH